jgi:predicted metal-binding membrane protein
MDTSRLLVGLRLARPARRRGFCPACAIALTGDPQSVPGIQLATDGITVAIVLGVAMVAWAVTGWQTLGRGMGMAMGLGSVGSFAVTWTVMMAAMMLPSAIPLVYRFARLAEGRSTRPVAVVVLCLVYLAVWLAFGVLAYVAYSALGMPWPNNALVGGVALGLAAVYALSPLKRISQNRCREVCALHGPLPFNLVRAGAVAGWRYGLSCLGCTVGLMVAMVLIRMTSVGWTIVLAVIVLLYKFAPTTSWRLDMALAALVGVLGVVYATFA